MKIMDERAQAILLFILFLAMCLVALYFYSGTQAWHDKYQQLLDTLTAKLVEKDKQIEKLENEIKTYKNMERVVKFERVIMEPKELECKFQAQEELIDHTDLFKRLCVSEAARYLAEEIERQPTLYSLTFEKNPMICCENVRMRFRFLPYPEGLTFEEYEERRKSK